MEILHKAKRIDNGKWVEGYYNKRHGVYGEVDFIFWSKVYNHWNNAEINPETVCVYIGKNDEKGNKIWSHDIIEISTYNYTEPAEYYFGEIIYCEAWACWCIKEPHNGKSIPLHECEGSYKTEITRLGNIFDDADLLGV